MKQDEIAREAGVSTATVSRVLSNSGLVSEVTRREVIAAARRLGMGVLEGGTVGLILPDSQNPFFTDIAFRLQSRLAREGLLLLMAASENRLDKELHLLEQYRALSMEALVYIAVSESADVFDKFLAEPDLPTIVIDRRIPYGNLDSVTTTSGTAIHSAVASLLVNGHKRLAYAAGPPETATARERLAAFKSACTFNGLDSEKQAYWHGAFTIDSGREIGELVLSSSDRPTAIVAGNDLIAIGLMQHLQEAGLHIPRDISIVGFDGVSLSDGVFPRLSTVEQPIKRLVEETARLVTKRVGERRDNRYPDSLPEHVELSCRYVSRASVGPCKTPRRPIEES